MNTHTYKNLIIQVFDDTTYQSGSADHKIKYSNHYFAIGANQSPVSKHGIVIRKDGEEINSCIVIGSGGATGVAQNSSLIDSDLLLICCCDTIFCLKLPTLELNWTIQADQATCFQIYKLQDDYVVHGELTISRIDKNGNIKWQYSCSDIFVTPDGNEAFTLNSDHIILTDFNNLKYKVDFNGSDIE